MSEYTSSVPVDHPRAMFYVYYTLIGAMWVSLVVSIALTWPGASIFLGVANAVIALLIRNRVWAMKERMEL